MKAAADKRIIVGPDSYWKHPGFARKYVFNTVIGVQKSEPMRMYAATCLAGIVQGILHLTPEPRNVLEVGCGHAQKACSVRANTGARTVGLDYSETMLEEAAKIIDMLPEEHRAELVQGDVHNMPFDDNEFDVSFSYGLLMSVPDGQRAVKEIMRVSRYGLVAIEETHAVMDDEQLAAWSHVKDKVFPGRIYWHDYHHLFGRYKEFIHHPITPPPDWDVGYPPAYARFIVTKENHAGNNPAT